ncbi:hypothetical protein [Psychroserpens luteolus]|uniref:hypothetical protein n=1 Tax=Psychroserpens luteolus TaxID=2855840 RepID=UPI001E459358|nr:hypothetical protein [Psychroserpens luteolus]MCD2259699.1 hypothetical protein [Psychroserpens luteolus]
MILDSTHFNKEHKKIIIDLIGKPFSFFEVLKMKGIGSKRMIIEDASPNMTQYLNKVSDINYANIEMRSHGILIYINKGLKNFTWVIPYYQLVIYKTNGTSIHAQGKYIHFRNNKTFKENKQFFDKLLQAKVNYDEQFNFQF